MDGVNFNKNTIDNNSPIKSNNSIKNPINNKLKIAIPIILAAVAAIALVSTTIILFTTKISIFKPYAKIIKSSDNILGQIKNTKAFAEIKSFNNLNQTVEIKNFLNTPSTTELSLTNIEKLSATSEKWQEVLNYAKENLPTQGQLMMNSDGYVYLKVDNAYIHELFPMLDVRKDGFKLPPFFHREEAPGAHISIFRDYENIIPKEELGKYFSFELKKIEILNPSFKQLIALQIYSPELESLRIKYGLLPKIHNHEFHITLAKKIL